MVSALAMTGIRLTRVPSRFIVSMSRGFKLIRFEIDTSESIPLNARHRLDSRMSVGSDEVKTSVHPHIDFIGSMGLLFLAHKVLVLVVQKVDDG
jgi:hypothetical protein